MAKFQIVKLGDGSEIRLTEREMLFCQYYLGECERNATQAAVRAGYSEITARRIATKNMSKVHIQKYLKEQTATVFEKLGVTKERVLRKLRDVAFTNLTDLVDDDWCLKKKSEIPEKYHAALGSVEIDERIVMQEEGEKGTLISRKVKYKMKDDLKALISLAELTGLIEKNTNQPGESGEPKQINLFQQINNYIEKK